MNSARGLHSESAAELADVVRIMNSYYSNLIEGHNTRPQDIESALAGAEIDPERRPLALEAKAHVEVQRMIDGLELDQTKSLYDAIRYDDEKVPLSEIVKPTNFPGLDIAPANLELQEFEYDTLGGGKYRFYCSVSRFPE